MKLNWFKIFFYLSLFFLAIALAKADYLSIPHISNPYLLVLSMVLLFLGFIFDGVSWGMVLKKWGYSVNAKSAIISSGISIFGKYIPGKFWVILGRAEYIVKKFNHPRKAISSLSLNTQLIFLWVGILFGTIGIVTSNILDKYNFLAVILFIILSIAIFTPVLYNSINKTVLLLTNKGFRIPQLDPQKTVSVLPWFVLIWGFWSLSFYFLCGALLDEQASFSAFWTFGLAASIGMVVLFAPGGLGIREGIISAYLIIIGISTKDAATIAVASRLWFLSGEVFIFLLATLLKTVSFQIKKQL
jgi:uncharacterized membrane protein YbhN (UPF0104 family)